MNGTSRWSRVLTLIVFSALAVATGCGGGSDSGTGQAPGVETPPAATAPEPAAPAPASDGPRGSASVAGTVRFEGEAPKMKAIKMDADPGCAKKHAAPVESELLVLGEGNTMANIFVQVKGGPAEAAYPAPAEPAVIDQQGCRYVPHVLGIMVGQPLKIKNSDGLLHNVHSLPKVNKSFNKAMPASVTEVVETFSKPEPMFKIKCDVHPWMGAYVTVLRHPFFDVTEADGKFEIAGLPAGTYEIEAWHEKLGTQTATVTVADGETGSADFVYSK